MREQLCHPQFFTATILEWKHLLKPDKYKELTIESPRFLVREKRVGVFAFAIMSNHLHLIWKVREGHKKENLQRGFPKFTVQMIKEGLLRNHPKVPPHFLVAPGTGNTSSGKGTAWVWACFRKRCLFNTCPAQAGNLNMCIRILPGLGFADTRKGINIHQRGFMKLAGTILVFCANIMTSGLAVGGPSHKAFPQQQQRRSFTVTLNELANLLSTLKK